MKNDAFILISIVFIQVIDFMIRYHSIIEFECSDSTFLLSEMSFRLHRLRQINFEGIKFNEFSIVSKGEMNFRQSSVNTVTRRDRFFL